MVRNDSKLISLGKGRRNFTCIVYFLIMKKDQSVNKSYYMVIVGNLDNESLKNPYNHSIQH